MIPKYSSRLLNLKPHYSNEEFKKLPIRERWEIRISDGILINAEKLVETTLSKREIKANPEIMREATEWLEGLVELGLAKKAPTGTSYYLTSAAVESWHEAKGLRLGIKLIDKNLPARVYSGVDVSTGAPFKLTETEGFLLAPRRPVVNLSIKESSDLKPVLQEALLGVGVVMTGQDGRLVVRAAAPEPALSIMRETAQRWGSGEPIRVSYPIMRRDRTDVPPEFYNGLIAFYTMFSRALVQASHKETVNVYLGKGSEEQDSFWASLVAEAFSKYNEAGGVPFAAYLASAIANWINDLPTHVLGQDLAGFQRNRKRAIRELLAEAEYPQGHRFSDRVLAGRMGIPVKEYQVHKTANENWIKVRTIEELGWKENGQERVTHHLDPSRGNDRDAEAATDMLLAILDTGISLLDGETADICLDALAKGDVSGADFASLEDIPDSFKVGLWDSYKARREESARRDG